MKTKNKILLLILCMTLVVMASVFGTLAYFTADDHVENTYTAGNIGLTLDEAKVNTDGTLVTDKTNRGQGNEYHLLPGRTYIKDPTVTVEEGSEEAYVRMIVKVRNINELEKAFPAGTYYADLDGDTGNGDDFVLHQLLGNTWNYKEWHFAGYKEVTVEEGGANVVYGQYEFRHYETVKAKDEAKVLVPLFEKMVIPGEIDNDHIAYLEDVKVDVYAHAMQVAGFEGDEDLAWDKFDVQNAANL